MASMLSDNGSETFDRVSNHNEIDTSKLTNIASILTTPGFDSSRLHPLAGLEKGVEYMDLEDEQLSTMEGSQGLIPSRGWSDDLCYGTGAVYLLGLGLGGFSGFVQGVKAIPPNASGRLQLNTILNSVTKRGPFMGNSAGILALGYNIINSSIDAFRGKHDVAGSVIAGGLTGALFRASRGPKQMAYASGIVAGVAGLWSGTKDKILE
ncbi:similar to Saccharomyces cerevisiae YNR017W TIM23 Essential component of the Translocase of the Inner Mitochondrial membrane (TIM23 complex) [Maudiozyma barnettii]|uniref:Mitochondrial import inner membrane translocase subunit TIM23 n=1 Tax=Maudiozyma barnettii TaxID=61262 RepID=A0A8H2VHN4_9SACH|nr:protein transporter TIM23 [Kazachstania barnettii]CAB4255404.1 similar to Saccharomyces cerevisiae YNR017W TIM23 Essential component of the Translocase of the Inner Mitochondrial membrane (TIM23 complex) [Kazachstania barnettii]CAD1783811.1 similar to Saccharomyces cerevisiae YNR017W TIM23 Essential component of the Translocase of the Inner Mitochondrial membrane (TIM23 complex) [Kazachstania barnettii]